MLLQLTAVVAGAILVWPVPGLSATVDESIRQAMRSGHQITDAEAGLSSRIWDCRISFDRDLWAASRPEDADLLRAKYGARLAALREELARLPPGEAREQMGLDLLRMDLKSIRYDSPQQRAASYLARLVAVGPIPPLDHPGTGAEIASDLDAAIYRAIDDAAATTRDLQAIIDSLTTAVATTRFVRWRTTSGSTWFGRLVNSPKCGDQESLRRLMPLAAALATVWGSIPRANSLVRDTTDYYQYGPNFPLELARSCFRNGHRAEGVDLLRSLSDPIRGTAFSAMLTALDGNDLFWGGFSRYPHAWSPPLAPAMALAFAGYDPEADRGIYRGHGRALATIIAQRHRQETAASLKIIMLDSLFLAEQDLLPAALLSDRLATLREPTR